MAVIAFFPDLQTGHLLSTFGLARSLVDRGHEVHYIGIIENRAPVLEFGFSYHVVFENEYPANFMKNLKENYCPDSDNDKLLDHIPVMLGDSTELDIIIDDIKPDILISTAFIPLGTLILHYRYKLPQIILSPNLRSPAKSLVACCTNQFMLLQADIALKLVNFINERADRAFERIPDMATPLAEIPELVLCPREFMIPQWGEYSSNVHFIEPSIRKDVGLVPSLEIPEGKQVIFASMGSQAFRFKSLIKHFYSTMLEVMRVNGDKNWHAVIVIPSDFQMEELGLIPANVSVFTWINQMEVLKRSSLAVTHGGIGTVKECIYVGVPIIALPLGNDQFDTAECLQHHKLGIEMDMENLTASELGNTIRYLLTNTSVKESVAKTKALFHEREEAQIGAKFIEGLINYN